MLALSTSSAFAVGGSQGDPLGFPFASSPSSFDIGGDHYQRMAANMGYGAFDDAGPSSERPIPEPQDRMLMVNVLRALRSHVVPSIGEDLPLNLGDAVESIVLIYLNRIHGVDLSPSLVRSYEDLVDYLMDGQDAWYSTIISGIQGLLMQQARNEKAEKEEAEEVELPVAVKRERSSSHGKDEEEAEAPITREVKRPRAENVDASNDVDAAAHMLLIERILRNDRDAAAHAGVPGHNSGFSEEESDDDYYIDLLRQHADQMGYQNFHIDHEEHEYSYTGFCEHVRHLPQDAHYLYGGLDAMYHYNAPMGLVYAIANDHDPFRDDVLGQFSTEVARRAAVVLATLMVPHALIHNNTVLVHAQEGDEVSQLVERVLHQAFGIDTAALREQLGQAKLSWQDIWRAIYSGRKHFGLSSYCVNDLIESLHENYYTHEEENWAVYRGMFYKKWLQYLGIYNRGFAIIEEYAFWNNITGPYNFESFLKNVYHSLALRLGVPRGDLSNANLNYDRSFLYFMVDVILGRHVAAVHASVIVERTGELLLGSPDTIAARSPVHAILQAYLEFTYPDLEGSPQAYADRLYQIHGQTGDDYYSLIERNHECFLYDQGAAALRF